MASYMRPSGQLIPAQGETDVHYFIQMFDDPDLSVVQTEVNAYLLLLEDGSLPQFALIETEHVPYQTPPPMPEVHHVIKLTLMWVGGPLGFIPPSP